MQIPQSEKITFEQTQKLLQWAQDSGHLVEYHREKHQLVFYIHSEWYAKIYLPWTYLWDSGKELIKNPDPHFSLCLVKAGQATVGYFHHEKMEDHKVFRAYMVRQKQGKSQIKYLNTKGKSRAGSRIRLAETERFFEEINERLNSYQAYPIDFWGISCGKTLWPYLFSSSTPPPFVSGSSNLIELPFHVSQASFEELESAGKLLLEFHLLLSEAGREMTDFLRSSSDEEENW
ncbi:hypothetical protein [Algoriphagus mannitolivorans]|uniref:hypothetical protein n=1 Tax=Algoriphagus mannitolivorans TaxID=226504 RepID=UPI000403591D|nr:hypothetical protein [Algoriphagus mannitolivorans]